MAIMSPSKTTVALSVAAILLAALASPPKLRGGVRMAVLLAQHGLPYHAANCVVRLAALSQVPESTCSNSPPPRGTNACYLISNDDANQNANTAAWDSMSENDRGQALNWFALLQDADGATDLRFMMATAMGLDVIGLSHLSEDEYMRAIGAAHRSLLEEGLQSEECEVAASFMDTNNDGMISLSERMAPAAGDCDDQASDSTLPLCHFYVQLVTEYMPQNEQSVEAFCSEFQSEGASIKTS